MTSIYAVTGVTRFVMHYFSISLSLVTSNIMRYIFTSNEVIVIYDFLQ